MLRRMLRRKNAEGICKNLKHFLCLFVPRYFLVILDIQSFDFERTWLRLYQKRAVRTKA